MLRDQNSQVIRPMSANGSLDPIILQGCCNYALQFTAAASPSAKTFTAAVTDVLTAAAHGFYTGLKVQLTTTGTLPAGLALTTDYWVIRVTADTFKLADSLAHADAGTAVDVTDVGTGTHTATATAGTLAHSMQLEKSMDGVKWYSEGSATAVSAAGSTLLEGNLKGYRLLRLTNAVTTGQAQYSWTFSANGGD